MVATKLAEIQCFVFFFCLVWADLSQARQDHYLAAISLVTGFKKYSFMYFENRGIRIAS